jgi:predicted aldo/keto reductase-like oxidoreductase
MERRTLGATGIAVSRLCFGTLPLGPLQTGLPPVEGGALLAHAMDRGVDFVDTAELYGTYAHVREAARLAGRRPTVCTKSYAHDREGARESLERARRELDQDVVDLFLLHEQETPLTLLGHRQAYEYLLESKAKGLVRAVGFSTHAAAPVEAAVQAVRRAGGGFHARERDPWEGLGAGPYDQVDVIHPILNRTGLGLIDGPPDRMLRAVQAAHEAGIGILGMKLFGGGNLLGTLVQEAAFGLSLPFVDAYAVGMQSRAEIEMDVALFEGRTVPEAVARAAQDREKRLLVHDWCTGCGACVARCTRGAMALGSDGRACVDRSRCVLCGYCAAVCRDFAIKVV